MLLQAAELRLQDTDSLREHQQQELSSKLLVAEGALATMKEELGAQASRHAEELQRLEASLETVSAARQDLQHQLDTATERVQQLETELKARCSSPDGLDHACIVEAANRSNVPNAHCAYECTAATNVGTAELF